jgi:hypothetical protein
MLVRSGLMDEAVLVGPFEELQILTPRGPATLFRYKTNQ